MLDNPDTRGGHSLDSVTARGGHSLDSATAPLSDRFHRAVYVISVAAELAGMHPQTLRVYERRGLLEPARTAGGSRRYSDADLARLERIGELTGEGLNLAGVIRVLDLEQQIAELQTQLDAHGTRPHNHGSRP